jgi:hypothetical protein
MGFRFWPWSHARSLERQQIRLAVLLPIIDRDCDHGSEVNHWNAEPPNPGLNVSSIRWPNLSAASAANSFRHNRATPRGNFCVLEKCDCQVRSKHSITQATI